MGYDFGGLTALVVDDLRLDRNILVSMLQVLGIGSVTEAGDGSEALEMLAVSEPDIIFVDHRMSPMGGLELIEHVRSGKADVEKFIPIIVVSAYTELREVIKTRDLGATEFIAKPISADLIYQRLCGLIEHPRPFIETRKFFGPDRRRRVETPGTGERRHRGHRYSAA